MCLVPTTPGSGANEKCRRAVKTARGLYWGLESRSLDSVSSARGLEPGDRISLEAEILQLAPEDFESWMSSGASGRIEGVLKVHSLKRLPAQ
jgi:hypothetical protein